MKQSLKCVVSRLNPCCNGIGSKTSASEFVRMNGGSLNPCCNGIGSKTAEDREPLTRDQVLILVVMEEGQRPRWHLALKVPLCSLNPCCNGRGSKTVSFGLLPGAVTVLILVVMEEGQRPQKT